MDVRNTVNGSLQISTDVIAKIAKLAALEINGVDSVTPGTAQSVRSLLGKANLQRAVTVEMQDGVATIGMSIIAKYGCKIMNVCEAVQDNVKTTIQNMTGITVSHVNVTVSGLAEPAAAED